MVNSQKFIFSECLEMLVRLNQAEAALGYMYNTSSKENDINLKSKLTTSKIYMSEKEINTLTEQIEQNLAFFMGKDEENYINNENSKALSNKLIKNIRCIQLTEDKITYAFILLFNVKKSSTTKQLPNIQQFKLSSVRLIKSQRQKPVTSFLTSNSATEFKNEMDLVHAIFKKTFHPSFIFDDEFKILKANTASHRLFSSNINRGWCSVDKLLKKAFPSIASNLLSAISKFGFIGHLQKEEWVDVAFMHNSFESVIVDIHLFPIKYSNKQCFGFMVNEKNSNSIKTHEYQTSLQRFNALTSVVPMAILQLDNNWSCSYANETWVRYSGQTIDESMGTGWMSSLYSRDAKEVLSTIYRVTSYSKNYSGEIQLKKKNQTSLWVSINAVGLFNDKYELTGFILTIHDVSESYLHAEKLEKIANYDHLTGLSNRSFFIDRLTVALLRSKRHGLTALMFLDLDKFKNINDTLGHPIGDQVIQKVAKCITSVVRDEDSIARLGGDEFAIIITDIKTLNVLATIAKKIIDAIHIPFSVGEHMITTSCSIGIATSDEKNLINNPNDMLKNADLALYKAKDSGRNQYYFYDSNLEKNTTILKSLRNSLNNSLLNEFSLVFQPQIDSKTEEVFGFEALSRWNNLELGQIGPDVFIKVIEGNGLVQDFSKWLFNEVIEIVKQWVALDLLQTPQRVSVNLSAKQLHIRGFCDSIISMFKEYEISTEWFTLEVTETAFIDDPYIAGKNIEALREAGFLIALDDFGTGFSSLSLLRQMPLDYIKIDQSFIRDVLDDNDAARIVESLIKLCEDLKLKVIAEGVENTDTKQWLELNNCMNHQGYLFSKPLSRLDTEILLKNISK